MDSLAKLLEEMCTISLEPVVSEEEFVSVLITHIIHPESFYVRPIRYQRYLPDIETPGDPISQDKLHLGKSVLFRSQELDKFVRGRIELMDKVDDTVKCTIMCLDYGFTETLVDTADMYEAKPIPPLAIHCKLSCKPTGKFWTQASIDTMKIVIGSGLAKMRVIEKTAEQLTVHLECLDDVTNFLILSDHAFFNCAINAVSRNMAPEPAKHFIKHQQFKEGEILCVQVQSGKFLDGFYVALEDQFQKYKKEIKRFNQFCLESARQMTVEKLRVGELVGVTMDKPRQFERGVIVEVLTHTRARTQLLDWGNCVETNITAMRLLDENYLHPALAIYCAAEEEQSTDMRLQRFISKGRELIITVKKTGDCFNTPYIVHVVPNPYVSSS